MAEYYRQVFDSAGLTLERIGLRPYANVRTLQAAEFTQGRVVLVDIGPSMTEINILRDGHLMYTRAATVAVPVTPTSGASDATLAAAQPWAMDSLLIEVNRTIAAYRATDLGATIDPMILAGIGAEDERLVPAFEERFSIPTQIQTVPKSIRWKTDFAGSVAPFSAAVGLALSSMGERSQCFDFLHVKEPEAEHRERAKKRPVVAATVGMFALAGVVVAYQPIRQKNIEIAGIQDSIKTLDTNRVNREEALKRIADLAEWQSRDVIWIDYFKKIAAVFPSNKDCYINKLEVNSTKGIIIMTLAATDEFQARKVVDAIKSITDARDQPLFDARSGFKASAAKIPEYPVSDEVTVTVLSLVPKQKKR